MRASTHAALCTFEKRYRWSVVVRFLFVSCVVCCAFQTVVGRRRARYKDIVVVPSHTSSLRAYEHYSGIALRNVASHDENHVKGKMILTQYEETCTIHSDLFRHAKNFISPIHRALFVGSVSLAIAPSKQCARFPPSLGTHLKSENPKFNGDACFQRHLAPCALRSTAPPRRSRRRCRVRATESTAARASADEARRQCSCAGRHGALDADSAAVAAAAGSFRGDAASASRRCP